MKINSEFDLGVSILHYEHYLERCICAIFDLSEEVHFNNEINILKIDKLKEKYLKSSNNESSNKNNNSSFDDQKLIYIEILNLFDIDDYESRPHLNNQLNLYRHNIIKSNYIENGKNSKDSNLLYLLSKKTRKNNKSNELKSECNEKIHNKNTISTLFINQYHYVTKIFSSINLVMNTICLYYTDDNNFINKSIDIFKGISVLSLDLTNLNEVILIKIFYVLIFNVVKLTYEKIFDKNPEVYDIFDNTIYYINNKNSKFIEQNIYEINKLFLNINKCLKAFTQIGNHFDFCFSKEVERISAFFNVRIIIKI